MLHLIVPSPLPKADPIRIAVVDDHPALLMGLSGLLGNDGRYRIVGTGGTAGEALELSRREPLDVLVLDLSMPGDAFATIIEIVASSSATKIIVFTAFAEVGLASRAIDAGAHAFVLKGRPLGELHEAVASVLAGSHFVSPGFSEKLLAGWHSHGNRGGVDPVRLSAREVQLLQCLLEAMTNRQIAAKLDLTEKTVKHYMTNLMNKLKVRSRLEVVLEARRQGLNVDTSLPSFQDVQERS
ncbi:MAG: response regulator transcription factor [Devosia sp.]